MNDLQRLGAFIEGAAGSNWRRGKIGEVEIFAGPLPYVLKFVSNLQNSVSSLLRRNQEAFSKHNICQIIFLLFRRTSSHCTLQQSVTQLCSSNKSIRNPKILRRWCYFLQHTIVEESGLIPKKHFWHRLTMRSHHIEELSQRIMNQENYRHGPPRPRYALAIFHLCSSSETSWLLHVFQRNGSTYRVTAPLSATYENRSRELHTYYNEQLHSNGWHI